jgi:hypothetical protein
VNGPEYPTPLAPPAQSQAPGAVAALVLGVLSIVLCPLCGPVAWSLGRRAEQAADGSGGRLGGRGLATAGKVLGMIGTFFLLLLIVFLVLTLAIGGGGSESGSFV